MKKPKKKGRLDFVQLAKAVVDAAADELPTKPSRKRQGGLKGGPARATKLNKERRSEIAKRAAEARWAKRDAEGRN